MIQPDPWDRQPGWYLTALTADTTWPYARTVLLSGPHPTRDNLTGGDDTKVRFWDGKAWRRTDDRE